MTKAKQRGDVLIWKLISKIELIFLLLEDHKRSIKNPRTLCLVLSGEIFGRQPGQTVPLLGIIAAAKRLV